MTVDRPARGPSNHWRPVVFLVLSCLAFSAFTRAQDVAEAARQERARKGAEHKATHYVYTEEDLKRDKILTPEDQAAKVATREKQQQAALGEQNAESVPAEQSQQPESLGDVARRYREQKAEHDAEQAEKK